MRKYSLFGLIVVLSFGFVGCIYSGNEWSKGLRENREATVCDKEIVQISSPDNPSVNQSEYRVQLTWNDVERNAHPMIWSVVSERVYKVMDLGDKVTLMPYYCGIFTKGRVTATYYWSDDRAFEINEFNYEFDLPKNDK